MDTRKPLANLARVLALIFSIRSPHSFDADAREYRIFSKEMLADRYSEVLACLGAAAFAHHVHGVFDRVRRDEICVV